MLCTTDFQGQRRIPADILWLRYAAACAVDLFSVCLDSAVEYWCTGYRCFMHTRYSDGRSDSALRRRDRNADAVFPASKTVGVGSVETSAPLNSALQVVEH